MGNSSSEMKEEASSSDNSKQNVGDESSDMADAKDKVSKGGSSVDAANSSAKEKENNMVEEPIVERSVSRTNPFMWLIERCSE